MFFNESKMTTNRLQNLIRCLLFIIFPEAILSYWGECRNVLTEFDFSVLSQQNILTLNVSVNNMMGM